MIAPDIVFLDCETLPTVDVDLIAAIEKEVSPPGNMKKAETIQAWHENEGVEARREAVRRTSLDGGTGRLGALAWGWADQPIVSAHTAVDGAWSIDRERELLRGFFAELDGFRAENRVPPTLVGHNISGFDVRWLWKRSVVLGIRPPVWWPIDARPWDQERVQDTMILWEGAKGRISQDRLARTLGIKGKGAIDGSQVADRWESGEHEEIRLYCADDVRTVREIWCRLTGEDAPADDEVVPVTAAVEDEVEVQVGIVADPGPVEVPVEIALPEPVVEASSKKAKIPRPRVVPVFLRDCLPEDEAA